MCRCRLQDTNGPNCEYTLDGPLATVSSTSICHACSFPTEGCLFAASCNPGLCLARLLPLSSLHSIGCASTIASKAQLRKQPSRSCHQGPDQSGQGKGFLWFFGSTAVISEKSVCSSLCWLLSSAGKSMLVLILAYFPVVLQATARIL